jgi:hypothetical protein
MPWVEADAKKYILSQLGHPKRLIELDHSQVSEALKKAVKTYSSTRPVIKRDSFYIYQGVQAYNFTTLNKPYGKGVLSCIMAPITSPQAVLSEFEYYRLRQPPYVDLSELVTDKLYYKEVGLLTGSLFDWQWEQDSTTMLVTPAPTRSARAAYEYNYDPQSITEVPTQYQDWCVDYALALTKQMLSRVRGKFKGVPGSELSVDTDSDALMQEATQEMQALKELLNKRGDWTPPILG